MSSYLNELGSIQSDMKTEPPYDEINLDQPGPSGLNPLDSNEPEQVQYGPKTPEMAQESMETNEDDEDSNQNEQPDNGSKVIKNLSLS